MKLRSSITPILLMAVLGSGAVAETVAQKDARLKWWDEARFGLFVTWGLYAIPAGVWEDGRVCRRDYGEWIMKDLGIPFSRYERLAAEWNPRHWDPEALVRRAAEAGMKYLVFTTKFHDGFSMFDTGQSEWTVVKSTPWGRDAFRGLAQAARRYGLKLMPYYSIMDWRHPAYEPRSTMNDTAAGRPDMDRYVKFMKAQLAELQKNYGPLAGIWFDGNWEKTWTEERGRDLDAYVRALIPGAVINNRVGLAKDGVKGIVHGDFSTPEEEIPADGSPGLRWESAMTMNETWGYRRDDLKWKSPTSLVRMLIDCASKGGNLLLDVGPTADGRIPDPSLAALEAFASWMKINRASIHGTQAGPFPKAPAWGRITRRGRVLFLHVFEWPADHALVLPLRNAVAAARILGHPGAEVQATSGPSGLRLRLPEVLQDPYATVVELTLEGDPEIIR
jgi:alpha-L-fucosidase